MSEFKVGDRVRDTKGSVGTVYATTMGCGCYVIIDHDPRFEVKNWPIYVADLESIGTNHE